MIRRYAAILMLVLLAIASGCDKPDDDANRAEGSSDEPQSKEIAEQSEDTQKAEGEEEEKTKAWSAAVAEDTPFAAYDLEGVARKWQGSWTVPGSALGTVVAWNVDGAKVTVFDGDEEKSLDLQIYAPCAMAIIEKKDGASSSTHKVFAGADTKIFAGLGSAGVLTDEGAVVCSGGKVYELAKNGCVAWNERFGRWQKTSAACTLEAGTFSAGSTTLERVDGALVDAQMKRNEVRSFESFEEAKASLQQENTSSR